MPDENLLSPEARALAAAHLARIAAERRAALPLYGRAVAPNVAPKAAN